MARKYLFAFGLKMRFQTLIGRLVALQMDDDCKRRKEFQTLIGRLVAFD